MSSKYLKDVEARRPKFIHVYPNGDVYARATFVVLRQVEQKDLELIIKAIEEKVRLPRNRPIRKIFEMNGILVTSCIQIEDGKFYVAASAENFLPLSYGQGIGWVRVGPVRTSKYANVHYVSKSEEEGTTKSLNSSSNMLASTKDTKERVSKPKSTSRKTPSSIKKESRRRSSPKRNMVASEHIETLPARNEEIEEPYQEGYVAAVIEDINDLGEKSQFVGTMDGNSENTDAHVNEVGEENHDGKEPTSEKHLETSNVETKYEEQEEIRNNIDENIQNKENEHNTTDENKDERSESNKEEEKTEDILPENKERNHEEKHTFEENNKEELKENHNEHNKTEEKEEQNGDIVENVMTDMTDKDIDKETLDEAATKIQATFRGHRARSELENMKEDVHQDLFTNNTEVTEEGSVTKEES